MTDLLPGQKEAQDEILALRETITQGDAATLDMILGKAHTHNQWQDKPVSDDLLRRAYDLAKFGPTSMNIQPQRIVVLRGAAKDRLLPHLMEGNRAKTAQAPVTLILANDLRFFDRMAEVFPINPDAAGMFAGSEAAALDAAQRNGTLQAAYLMIALRAVGLDVAGMSGFDPAGVKAEFFADSAVEPNFLLNVGYGDVAGVFPRLPRLAFEDVVTII